MLVKKQYSQLIESDVFRKWKAADANKNTYFAHAFAIIDQGNNGEWQFGFYNPKTDAIISFFMSSDKITQSPETEIMKREETKILELSMDKVDVDYEEALKIAENLQREEYEGKLPMKKVMLLQHLPEGIIWNLSYLTMKFTVLNIRIDAVNRKIISHSKSSMMDFVSIDKGGEEKEANRDKNYIL